MADHVTRGSDIGRDVFEHVLGKSPPLLIPSAITRISPFPRAAVVLLHRIPGSAGQPYEVSDLLERETQWQANTSPQATTKSRLEMEVKSPDAILASKHTDELVKRAITLVGESYVRKTMVPTQLQRYWRYCRACAVASDALARQGEVNRALAYSAGLLHDIGRLALLGAYPEKYANLLALTERTVAADEAFEISDYERILFGLDRFTLASWLAEVWDLPHSIRMTVGKFQAPANVQVLDLIATVRFGCRLAHSLGFGLMPGISRLRPRDILHQLPTTIQQRWGDFNNLSRMIQSQLQQHI